MANKLSEEKIAQLFVAFCQKQSVRYVAQKCEVSQATIRRYRNKDNWDERIAQIKHKAENKADAEAAKRLAENLKIVRFAKAELVKKIKKKKDKSTSTYSELDKLVRLEEFLLGKPDSRPATGKFDELTTEELLIQLRRVRKVQRSES